MTPPATAGAAAPVAKLRASRRLEAPGGAIEEIAADLRRDPRHEIDDE